MSKSLRRHGARLERRVLGVLRDMQVIPNIKPVPRLLNSAAAEVQAGSSTGSVKASKHRLQRTGTFGGNGRAIFIGLLLGALAVAAVGYLRSTDEAADTHLASVRKFFAVRTRSVSIANPSSGGNAALRVQIDPSMLRVTAIALGHPRLAIINGKEVTEGDSITLSSADGGISVSMRITNIVEGRIELTDGTEIVTAPLVNAKGSLR